MLFQNYNNIETLTDKNLVSDSTRKKIRLWVTAIHAFVIVVPLTVYLIVTNTVEKKPRRVFVARVVNLPAPPQPVAIPVKPKTTHPEINVSKPKIKIMKPIVKKPKIKKTAWKPLDPNQIKIIKPKKVRKKPVKNKFDKKRFLKKLKPKGTNDKAVPVKAKSISSRVVDSFYESVGSQLYKYWTPPSATRLGYRHPSATVSVTINSTGKIISWKISKSSGFVSVDSSIRELMSSIDRLPQPPNGIRTFEIILQVD